MKQKIRRFTRYIVNLVRLLLVLAAASIGIAFAFLGSFFCSVACKIAGQEKEFQGGRRVEFSIATKCRKCDARGYTESGTCNACHGFGYKEKNIEWFVFDGYNI